MPKYLNEGGIMAKKTTISIEIQFGDLRLDLQVPRFVTKERLETLIMMNAKELQVTFPPSWELVLQGKKVTIAKDELLASYPISDGDQFKVQEKVVGD